MSELVLTGVTRRFPGVLANDRVDLRLCSGEIHALLGENGAGKSTLLKILSGLLQPDSGTLTLDGRPLRLPSPQAARQAGIGTVHQHFMLVDELSVAENVALASRDSLARVASRLFELSAEFGLAADPAAPVEALSVGERQRVEILRALYHEAPFLLLDEPTAVLTPQEVEPLFAALRRMRDQGRAIVFISHRLREVLELCDRVTILRHGRVVASRPVAGMDAPALARLMVGGELAPVVPTSQPAAPGPVRLRVEGMSCPPRLQEVSFEVRQGEVLGLAGVSGNGQSELVRALAGLAREARGRVEVDGRALDNASPRARLEAGLACIPEDRQSTGSILDFSLEENLALRDLVRPPLSRGGWIRPAEVRGRALRLIREFGIQPPQPEVRAGALSGGNLQKVVLARELDRRPGVLVAAQPTRGVDIGSSRQIHQLLLEQKQRGAAILLISEDLDELRELSDRIAVLFQGRLAGLVPPDTSLQQLGLLMAGGS